MDAFVLFPLAGGLIGGVTAYRDWSRKVDRRSPWAGSIISAVIRGTIIGGCVGVGAAAVLTVME